MGGESDKYSFQIKVIVACSLPEQPYLNIFILGEDDLREIILKTLSCPPWQIPVAVDLLIDVWCFSSS